MANYYAVARSNYVHVDDIDGLISALKPFPDLMIIRESETSDRYGIFCDDGGWGIMGMDDDGKEVDFDPEVHIMPYVKEEEVLVMLEVGHEKLRYLVGYATAYVRVDNKTRWCNVSINDIYSLASEKFGLPKKGISWSYC